ncbi:hypothetical protein E2562_017919 [Oryza meyeriana var. granulata]|uniref:Uncharacterized protein n=1 Tax=Oryza meyeriana var. granulata TaxID=110450 RepID=A0A6G1CR34_9ORYZ|nr:hypothetical protein E2562_017919 [Oryza meyeriana var. granulata]
MKLAVSRSAPSIVSSRCLCQRAQGLLWQWRLPPRSTHLLAAPLLVAVGYGSGKLEALSGDNAFRSVPPCAPPPRGTIHSDSELGLWRARGSLQ